MTTAAVIPVKQLVDAKQRLAGLLDAGERKQLFTAMVEDVLTTVEACVLIDRLIVVTDDGAVAELAGAYGAEIRPEPAPPGLIESVTATGDQLAEEGVDTLVFLPGDVPLVTADELEVVLEGFGSSSAAELLIVPASDLGGTNCVACSPPDCMTFLFGVDSFRKHLRMARNLGMEPMVAKLPGIGLDVDTPEDLAAFVDAVEKDTGEGRACSTVSFLAGSGVLHRLNSQLMDIG